MEYEVRITLQAQAHLREIRDYIAQKLLAPEAAKNTVQRLGTVMASLSQMPKRVPLIEEEPWRSEGVRVRAVRNFLIYFWVNEAEKTVQIIAVIYARRDQTRSLFPGSNKLTTKRNKPPMRFSLSGWRSFRIA